MALIVHKYGGTSMGSPERIRNVAKRVAKWARAGHQMVVVPSAMSGETNRLLGLAKELQPAQLDAAAMRELDAIAATGEQVSRGPAGPGAAGRGHAGCQLRRLAGADPDRFSTYTKARIESIDDARSARRPGRRQGGGHHRLPGHRRRRQCHHAGPRAAATPRPWPWRRR
jgi:aspartate kinase